MLVRQQLAQGLGGRVGGGPHEGQVVVQTERDLPLALAQPVQPSLLHQAVEPGPVVPVQASRQEGLLPQLGRRDVAAELSHALPQRVRIAAGATESLVMRQEERQPVARQGVEGGRRGGASQSQENLEVLTVAEIVFRSLRHQTPLDELLEVEQILDLGQQSVWR